MSKGTVQHFLKSKGLRYMIPQNKIQLTIWQKTVILKICRKWVIEGASSRNIVFTDETRYNFT